MDDTEALGVLRNIRGMADWRDKYDRGLEVPIWYEDEDGRMAVRMNWHDWVEFCNTVESWRKDQVEPVTKTELIREDRF